MQTPPRTVITLKINQICFSSFATILYSSCGKRENNIESKCKGMGSANFMEMQQRMQRELMSNPDTLRQVPFIASVHKSEYPCCFKLALI